MVAALVGAHWARVSHASSPRRLVLRDAAVGVARLVGVHWARVSRASSLRRLVLGDAAVGIPFSGLHRPKLVNVTICPG